MTFGVLKPILIVLQKGSAAVKLSEMIRPFQLRDLPLIHRLGERGVILQAEAALTSSRNPLRSAVVNLLVGRQFSTYVWRANESRDSAFVQLLWDEGCPTARIAYLSTDTAALSNDNAEPPGAMSMADEDLQQEDRTAAAWLPLLDQLVAEIGLRGAHSLIAEASETGPELSLLRKAGFAIYTRQDIWMADSPAGKEEERRLQRIEDLDEWDIQVLYSGIVPGLIQSVEPNPPLKNGQNWLLRENEDVVALIHFSHGRVADWMRMWIHPNASIKPRLIIQEALAMAEPDPSHPVYCCVRRYQSWLNGPLEEAGFQLWGSQAVMVRHIVQHARSAADIKDKAMATQSVPGTSPAIQSFGVSEGSRIESY